MDCSHHTLEYVSYKQMVNNEFVSFLTGNPYLPWEVFSYFFDVEDGIFGGKWKVFTRFDTQRRRKLNKIYRDIEGDSDDDSIEDSDEESVEDSDFSFSEDESDMSD